MELGEIGSFPGEGEFIYKRSKFCDGVYRVDLVSKAPLVRCRDCAYHETMTVSYSEKLFHYCTAEWCQGAEGDNPMIEPNGFCAWGERKEAE